ncbi:MAG: type II toxin-antitoxin system Phd/YefM family antitoxin [Candidatus Rokubacteria bacterium]|nr:type II toxin-antitoxin system Phd/YefM family antitoxin [Candidatus Rokubacteria bacterium]
MTKVLGVDKARPALGALVDKVVAGGEPVVIAKRTGRLAVLLSYEEFTALKALAEGKAKTRLRQALREIRRAVRKARLPRHLVDEALQATRGLR